MNKHIELVKKWLADPSSVTQEELEDNYKAARADLAAYCAAAYAEDGDVDGAAYYFKRYEEFAREKSI